MNSSEQGVSLKGSHLQGEPEPKAWTVRVHTTSDTVDSIAQDKATGMKRAENLAKFGVWNELENRFWPAKEVIYVELIPRYN